MGIETAIIGTGVLGAAASLFGANKQAGAANRATDVQQNMFGTTQQNIAPYIASGTNALDQIGGMKDYFNHQFGPTDLQNGLAPNYDFMKQQGLQAIGHQLGTQGGMGGGNYGTSLAKFAEDYAGNAYQQAFANYNTQRGDIYSRLYNIAGLGSNAAVGQGNIGANVGSSIGNTITSIGNANAAGLVGASNAGSNAVGNYLGWQYLNRTPQTTTGQPNNYLGSFDPGYGP